MHNSNMFQRAEGAICESVFFLSGRVGAALNDDDDDDDDDDGDDDDDDDSDYESNKHE